MARGERAAETSSDPLAVPAELRERWDALAPATANVFSTREWAEIWWRHFGAGRTPAVSLVADGAQAPLALLALAREQRGGLRLARFLGHGVADELGPVCAPADLPAALRALREACAGDDLLLAERLAGRGDLRTLGGTVVRSESSPVIALAQEGGWEGYLSARSANFRQQVRRRARRLPRALELRYRLSDPGTLARDLDALIALHSARWQGRSRAFAGAAGRFHREFTRLAAERGWLRLWLAESRGRPVAAWYGFRFAGVESFYQSGRDPALERDGVGAAILEHSIREAFADGMREYRLLRGDEAYKRRYASFDPQVRTLAVPGRPLGRLAVGAAAALVRRPRGRTLLLSCARGALREGR
jgi:CelD/BcsL family acetyltransferase involved in cellulose biosynthesis